MTATTAALRGRDRRRSRAAPPPATPAQPPPAPGATVMLRHDQVAPHPLNPRKDFDSVEAREALEALRENILARGLRQNLVVRAEPDANGVRYIVSGERRWRAIASAIFDGDLPADHAIPCLLQAVTDEEHALDALAENMLRRDLSPLEEARAFKALADGGARTAEIAAQVGRTQKHVQDRLKLLALSPEDQARMALPKDDPDHLSYTDARHQLQEHAPKAEAAEPVSEPPAPAAAPDFLSPEEELILVEVQHLCAAKPATSDYGFAGVTDQAPDLKVSPAEANLAQGGFLRFDYQQVVMLKPALAYLSRLAFTLDDPATTLLRKARTAAGFLGHVIDRLEAEDAYATAWLNERHPPTKITPPEALVVLEVVEAHKAAGNSWPGVEISPDYHRGVVEALVERELLSAPCVRQHRTYTSKSWRADRALTRYYPGWDQNKTRAKHLGALRAALAPDFTPDVEQQTYVTSWLNGPFALPPEVKAEEDRQKAEEAARNQRVEEQRAREDELKVRREQAVAELERDIGGLSPEARGARFADVLQVLGGPAPWTLTGSAYSYELATAANGARITRDSELSRRLMVLAINVAAGVDLAALGEPGKVTREQFERFIAERLKWNEPDLTDAQAASHAKAALERSLESEGAEFGDDNYSWDVDEAEEIADGYAEEIELLTPEEADAAELSDEEG